MIILRQQGRLHAVVTWSYTMAKSLLSLVVHETAMAAAADSVKGILYTFNRYQN